MKKIFFAVLLAITTLYILTAPPPAEAQTLPKLNFNTAKWEWQWSIANGGDAKEWHWKCGPATGQYTQLVTIVKGSPVAGATYQIPANKLLSSQGIWFCINMASNDFGESPPTNEASGDFGLAPVAGSSLAVKP